MRALTIIMCLIILVSCSSELDRCIKANIDEPPTYNLVRLMEKTHKSIDRHRTPMWKNSADRKIYLCINNPEYGKPSYDSINYEASARRCLREEREYREAKAKAICHAQGIY